MSWRDLASTRVPVWSFVPVAMGAALAGWLAHRQPMKLVETVRTVEKRVEVAKAVTSTAVQTAAATEAKTVTVTKWLPGGVVTKTVFVERAGTTTTNSQATATTEKSRVVLAEKAIQVTTSTETSRPAWSAAGRVGLGLDLRPHYEAEVSRRVVGPIWLTISADITGRAALAGLRVEF